jgi:hypothetical protein
MSELARWTVMVSRDTDIALRSYLAEHGGKKGDLSKFVERAVQKEVFRATLRDIQERNSDLSEEEIQALVDEEVAAARKEFWRDRKWWDE